MHLLDVFNRIEWHGVFDDARNVTEIRPGADGDHQPVIKNLATIT